MRLRHLCLLIFCLLQLQLYAQHNGDILHLTKDSLNRLEPVGHWRFTPTDLANGADTALNDSQWPIASSQLYVRNDTVRGGFKGIGWLRLHFTVDSEVARLMLALRIKQNGASEFYLDGRKVHTFGRLLPKDSAEYENPKWLSLCLPQMNAGAHVLAIRYANWDYLNNARRYNNDEAGPTVMFWEANDSIVQGNLQHSVILFAFVILFGIFITLSIVHLFLYLYYRADKANGHFSIFAGCLAICLLLPAVMVVTDNARLLLKLDFAEMLTFPAIGLSLSLLLNGLFSKRRWHFYIIAAVCASVVVVLFFFRSYLLFAMFALFISVPLEALYILLSAVWQKQPGARIIGGGLALLILLLLVVMAVVLVQGDIYVGDNSLGGQLLLLTLLLAILSIPVSMSLYLAWRFSRVNRDLKAQLLQVETLSAQAREQEAERQRLLENRQEELEQQVAERTASLRVEKEKSDGLLRNILPAEIAEELKEKGHSEARLYNDVTVLFTDFVDFTQKAEMLSPAALVAEIDACFKAFDTITEKYGLEKIKTVGDAYIAASGLPIENPSHAQDVVRAALEIRDFIQSRKQSNPQSFSIRLGVHSGPVVAGIVGVKKFAYDIWGDTVNTAARMEQHGQAGKINISTTTYSLVQQTFSCSYRGELEVKHKGKMGMYFVEG